MKISFMIGSASLIAGASMTLGACSDSGGEVGGELALGGGGAGGAAPGPLQELGAASSSARLGCSSDKDCRSAGQLCDSEMNVCVDCVVDADCAAGRCAFSHCYEDLPCGNSLDCESPDHVCVSQESGSGLCMECGSADDCEEGESCEQGLCGPPTGKATATSSELEEAQKIENGDFSDGSSGWSISAVVEPGPATIVEGEACGTQDSFTLGWSGNGSGMTLEPGSYSLSFSVANTLYEYGNTQLEAKVAPVQAPYSPVVFSHSFSGLESGSQQVELSFSVTEAVSEIGLAFNVSGYAHQVCFDDVVLKAL